MLALMLSITPYEAFSRANELLNNASDHVDSIAYYLSVAYRNYSMQVENMLILTFVENRDLSGKLAYLLFKKYSIDSPEIVTIALTHMLMHRRIDEILDMDTIYSPTVNTILHILKGLYAGMEHYQRALKLIDSMFDGNEEDLGIGVIVVNPRKARTPEEVLISNFKKFLMDILCMNYLVDFMYRCSKFIMGSSHIVSLLSGEDIDWQRYTTYQAVLWVSNLLTYMKDMQAYLRTFGNLVNLYADHGCEFDTIPVLRSYNFNTLLYEASRKARYERGSYEEVHAYMSKLDPFARACPDNPQLLLSKAIFLSEKDSNRDALRILETLEEKLGSFFPKGIYLNVLYAYGDYEKLKHVCTKYDYMDNLLSSECMYVNNLNVVGTDNGCLYYYNRGDYKEALKRCSEGSVEKLYSYIMLGMKDSAYMLLDTFLNTERDSSYVSYWNAGWFHMLRGNLDSALYYTQKALDMRPYNSFLLMNKAHIYLIKGIEDSALFYYEVSYRNNRKHGNYHPEHYLKTFKEDVGLLRKLFPINRKLLRKVERIILP